MKKRRRQIRRCSVCNKIGHNRSTCSKFKQADAIKESKKANKPLKFFVHHVNTKATASQHIINLKKDDIWQQIQAASPSNNQGQFYHFYHNNLPKQKRKIDKSFPIGLPEIDYYQALKPIKSKSKLNKKLTKQVNFRPTSGWPSPFEVLNLKLGLLKLNFKQILKKIKNISYFFANTSQQTNKVAFKFRQPRKILFTSYLKEKSVNYQKKVSNNLHEFIKIYLPLRRTVISIIVFSLIILAPSKAKTYYQNLKLTANKVTNNGTVGFVALEKSTNAILSGNINQAQSSLSQALENFDQAINEIKTKNKWLQTVLSIIPGLDKKIISQRKLITAGHNLTLGNTFLLRTLSDIQNNTSSTLTKNISLINKNLKPAIPYYEQALNDLNYTDAKVLPTKYQTKFSDLKILLTAFVSDLKNISNSAAAIQEIFGGKGLRRYLLVFQNPYEIRPTGGFIGSFALLEIKNGKIINLQIPAGGSYDLQGQLDQYVEPPAPLLLMSKRWHFRDANWFPDFPASAKKMLWFYRHSRNITADGVIAINAEVLNRILNLTGPIKDEKRDLVLTSANAIATIQKVVETGPEKKENKPKQILSDLAPKFIEYFKKINSQQALPLLYNLQEALSQKEIQLYFTDSGPQTTMSKLGWDGKILPTESDQDYIFVVNTNLQGQKSDAKIKQTIEHQVAVQPDGSILDTVTITRQHTGEAGEEFYGQTNIDYLRLYVPQGSQLISASGFSWIDDKYFKVPEKWYSKDLTVAQLEKEVDIDPLNGTRTTDEFGKTAFANWVITQPGQTSQVYFTYKLPFKIDGGYAQSTQKKWLELLSPTRVKSNYQIIVQKQSGLNSKFTSQIIYPMSWKPIWHAGENIQLASNGAMIKTTKLNKDKIWTLIMTKNQ